MMMTADMGKQRNDNGMQVADVSDIRCDTRLQHTPHRCDTLHTCLVWRSSLEISTLSSIPKTSGSWVMGSSYWRGLNITRQKADGCQPHLNKLHIVFVGSLGWGIVGATGRELVLGVSDNVGCIEAREDCKKTTPARIYNDGHQLCRQLQMSPHLSQSSVTLPP